MHTHTHYEGFLLDLWESNERHHFQLSVCKYNSIRIIDPQFFQDNRQYTNTTPWFTRRVRSNPCNPILEGLRITTFSAPIQRHVQIILRCDLLRCYKREAAEPIEQSTQLTFTSGSGCCIQTGAPTLPVVDFHCCRKKLRNAGSGTAWGGGTGVTRQQSLGRK